MKPFKELTQAENRELLRFPAYISLLAAAGDDNFDKSEEASAVKLSHIKTFSSDPFLAEFYKQVDGIFKKDVEQLDSELPKNRKPRQEAIKKELSKLETIVLKFDKTDISIIHRSMRSFKDHVSTAHHNVLVDFIFPMPIKGLSY